MGDRVQSGQLEDGSQLDCGIIDFLVLADDALQLAHQVGARLEGGGDVELAAGRVGHPVVPRARHAAHALDPAAEDDVRQRLGPDRDRQPLHRFDRRRDA